jgi:hypothetical protein
VCDVCGFMLQLSDVSLGGATVFPTLGIRVNPAKVRIPLGGATVFPTLGIRVNPVKVRID